MKQHDWTQLIGVLFVIVGLAMMWIPLGFIALGVALFLAGYAEEARLSGNTPTRIQR